MRLKIRRFAGLSYACRTFTASSAFLFCPASATCSSDHKLPFLCGKKRRFGRTAYVCRSITVASAFLFILHNVPAAFFYDGLDAKQLESCLLAPFCHFFARRQPVEVVER